MMPKDIMCGSACVYYILRDNNIKNLSQIKKDMIWTAELALSLKKNGVQNIEIHCSDSNLYDDFNDKNIDYSFDGFKYLKEVLHYNIPMYEKKLTKNVLHAEMKKCKYLILCVESRIFNNDKNMDGGHFIILTERNNNMIKIINPIKNKFEEKWFRENFLLKSCKKYGSWRILVKEEKND